LEISLDLYNSDTSQDSYPCYGGDGLIIDAGEDNKKREVYFKYNSDTGAELEPDILNGAKAYFYIPLHSSMLRAPADISYRLTVE
jgi:hypothetical protein